jgi:hypothetical protein
MNTVTAVKKRTKLKFQLLTEKKWDEITARHKHSPQKSLRSPTQVTHFNFKLLSFVIVNFCFTLLYMYVRVQL